MTIVLLWGCSGNVDNSPSGGTYTGGSGKDTTYYARNIQPIFNAHCSGSLCHIPGPHSGVTLTDYSSALKSVGNQYGTTIIKPYDADHSPIIDKISNTYPKYGIRMPYERTPLSQATIDTLKGWINRGALENN